MFSAVLQGFRPLAELAALPIDFIHYFYAENVDFFGQSGILFGFQPLSRAGPNYLLGPAKSTK